MAHVRYNIEQIAVRLFGEPNARLSRGADLRFGDRGSISVNIDKGAFFDFKTEEGGGALALIIYSGAAANEAEARRWLLDEGLSEREVRAPSRPPDKQQKGHDKARALWAGARCISGTPAAAYLRRRAISPELGKALRYHGAVYNIEARTPLPALLAAITKLESPGTVTAVQRTWLTHDGQKAAVSSPKKILGSVNGGAVVLSAFADSVIVGEGVETTLSASAIYDLPGIATLGATNMRRLEVPVAVVRVVIAVDQDANGVGRLAAEALAERIWRPDRQVEFAQPPAGYKDFNDAAQAAAITGRADE